MKITASCSSCSAEIIWAQSETGKPMPVDAEPVAGGNVELQLPDDPRDPPVAHVLRKGESKPPPLYVSHFTTCPNAALHRKGTKR